MSELNTISLEVNCCGFDGMTINGLPGSVEMFDTMAGRQGACVETAVDGYVAHTHLTRVRKVLCAKLEVSTGVERKKDGKKFLETEGAFIKRLEAELGDSLYTDHRDAATAAFAETPVNLSRMERQAGAGSAGAVAKKYLEMADAIKLAGKLDAFATKHGLELTGDADADQKIVGGKLKSIMLEAERSARAAATAALSL